MDDGPPSGPDLVSSAPDPSSSSAPPKRRWSPSTWRYAIEEVQPELASKPRSTHILNPSAPSERQRAHEPPTKCMGPGPQFRAGHTYGKESWEETGARNKHGQQETRLVEESMGRAKKKQNQERAVEASRSKRHKREMTPSELYFCDECAHGLSNGRGSSAEKDAITERGGCSDD